MNKAIRIAIVDDSSSLLAQLRQNLQAFDGVEILFVAGNGLEAWQQLEKQPVLPEVILMDIEMPVMDGIEATRIITAATGIKVLMLTVFDTNEKIFEAIKAGAAGYLLKDSKPHKIITAIEDVMAGGAAMSPDIAWKTLHLLRKATHQETMPTPGDYDLSARETELLQLLVEGHTYQQIADRMFISHGTVRKHVENIYTKLHIHSKVEAVNKANAYRWFSGKPGK
ncbi:response regulator transcription factor [Flavisolibacter sp. BT320]|nr:response regulator transcription factor [Flavisolibacter longurius]